MVLDLYVIHELYKENKLKITFREFFRKYFRHRKYSGSISLSNEILSSSITESESKPESEPVKYSVLTLFIILLLTTYLF